MEDDEARRLAVAGLREEGLPRRSDGRAADVHGYGRGPEGPLFALGEEAVGPFAPALLEGHAEGGREGEEDGVAGGVEG